MTPPVDLAYLLAGSVKQPAGEYGPIAARLTDE